MIDYKKILFITQCPDGYCELEKSQLRRGAPKIGRAQICKEHGGQLIQCKRTCVECNEVFYMEPRQNQTQRCNKCLKISENLIRKKSRGKKPPVKRKSRTKKKTETPDVNIVDLKKLRVISQRKKHKWRGEYCSEFISCIGSETLTCTKCHDFVGIFFGHDPARSIGCGL